MYKRVCVYVYIHMYMYIHTYIHTHMYIYIYIHICVWVCVYTCTYHIEEGIMILREWEKPWKSWMGSRRPRILVCEILKLKKSGNVYLQSKHSRRADIRVEESLSSDCFLVLWLWDPRGWHVLSSQCEDEIWPAWCAWQFYSNFCCLVIATLPQISILSFFSCKVRVVQSCWVGRGRTLI